MKYFLAVCLAALLPTARAQSDKPDPYAFKDDRLGMKLMDFQKDHAPTKRRVNVNGSGGTPVWGTRTDPGAICKAITSSITSCGYASTIVGLPANVSDFFVDGKLAEIYVSIAHFPGPLESVVSALQIKMGVATEVQPKTFNSSVGPGLVWSDAMSVAQFQPAMCMAHQGGYDTDARHTELDLNELLAGEYCVSGQSLSSGYSLVIFADKALAKIYIQRLEAADKDASDKAKGDL
jgi:hypothetical protein